MASTEYHEPLDLLSAETTDMHRAFVSAIEELEAIDWYQQRADACGDEDLRRILLHNKKEEVEHFLITLEWIRRRNPYLSNEMKKYLFSEGAITNIEEGNMSAGANSTSLGIGSLRTRSDEPAEARERPHIARCVEGH